MCPVRLGSPRLSPCCLCENWCHVACSYKTHLGRMRPCHIRILDPKRKIMVLSHPYLEDYVVLPTRAGIRIAVNQRHCELDYKMHSQDVSISRWCAASWINCLMEKHARLSAGLAWLPEASESGLLAKPDDLSRDSSVATIISLFEFWEEGVQLVRSLDAHHFNFPPLIAVLSPWNFASTLKLCLCLRLWGSLTTRESRVVAARTNLLQRGPLRHLWHIGGVRPFARRSWMTLL